MIGRVVQLVRRRAGEGDANRGGVFGARPHSAREVRSCGGVQGGVAEGVEGEDHILRGYRLPIMPAGTGPEVKSPGKRVQPFPTIGQAGPVRRGIDRGGAGRQVRQPFEDLVRDIPAHGFGHQRRDQAGRFAHRRNDDGSAFAHPTFRSPQPSRSGNSITASLIRRSDQRAIRFSLYRKGVDPGGGKSA